MNADEPSKTSATRRTAGDLSWPQLLRVLLRHAVALGARPDEAEDLVHDAIETMSRRRGWYDPRRGPVERVLKVVITNRLIDRHRSRGRHERLHTSLRMLPGPLRDDPASRLAARQAAELRAALLDRLDGGERAVLWAWISQREGELSGREAAASLGMSLSDFEASKKRLRRRCRAILTEMGVTEQELFGGGAGGGGR